MARDDVASTLARRAREVRRMVLTMAARGHTPHVGSSLSCVELMVALYRHALRPQPYQVDCPTRDRLLLSKGHAAMTQYACLAELGALNRQLLDLYASEGSPLTEHPCSRTLPGIEFSTGALGHGLAVGLGMSLALRSEGMPSRVFAILSDGELNEGTVWEAAQLAAARKADNLVAIVDCNGLQAMGRCDNIVPLDPIAAKWQAFGWSATEVDGHCLPDLIAAYDAIPLETTRPTAVVARTTKGKGVSFLEGTVQSHYWLLSDKELAQALDEVGAS